MHLWVKCVSMAPAPCCCLTQTPPELKTPSCLHQERLIGEIDKLRNEIDHLKRRSGVFGDGTHPRYTRPLALFLRAALSHVTDAL